MATDSARVPTLDGWRALAALAVIACHFGNVFQPPGSGLLEYGALGVDFFFGLSGLLITSLLLKEMKQTGTIALGAFYGRRFFRIVPACWAFVLFLWLDGRMQSWQELSSSLLFYRNYLPGSLGGAAANHLWTLAVEAHFYLLWPSLLLFAGVRRGAAVAAYLAIGCAAYRIVDAHVSHVGFLREVLPLYRTDLRLDALLWGCVVAFVLDNPKTRAQLQNSLRFVKWLAVALLFCILSVLPSDFARIWPPMLIPLLIAGTLLHTEWRFSRLLEMAPLRWLGHISYSLYIWQQVVFLIKTEVAGARTWSAWFAIPMIPLCAMASYYFVELPMIRYGRMFLPRRAAPVAETIPSSI